MWRRPWTPVRRARLASRLGRTLVHGRSIGAARRPPAQRRQARPGFGAPRRARCSESMLMTNVGTFRVRRDDLVLTSAKTILPSTSAHVSLISNLLRGEVDPDRRGGRRPRTSAGRARPRDTLLAGTPRGSCRESLEPRAQEPDLLAFVCGQVDAAATDLPRAGRRRPRLRARPVGRRSRFVPSRGRGARRAPRRSVGYRVGSRSEGAFTDRRNEVLLVHDLVVSQCCRSLVQGAREVFARTISRR